MKQTSKTSWKKMIAFFLLCQKGIGRRTIFAVLDSLHQKQTKPEVIWVHVCSHNLIKPDIKNDLLSFKSSDIETFYYSKRKHYSKDAISVVFFGDSEYPNALKKTDDPPLFLFCKGRVDLLENQGVALVGTRRVTAYGRMVTEKITQEVVSDGYCTISGCMYGVDELVHRVTLRQGGKTIAVLGYGFDHVYPRRMQPLLDQILLEDGLLVSEYFPEEEPFPGYFVARNRIIAGLSHSVIVTEAAQKSGSHGTALCAAAGGRAVFAVPGPITNPYSEGTKWLVNQGATLITSGFEVRQYHQGRSSDRQQGEQQQIPEVHSKDPTLEEKILSCISSGPTSIETLVLETESSISGVLVALSALELQSKVVKDGILWYLR